MIKKVILALCLVLAVLLTAVPAMAAGSVDAWLSASATSADPGSTVTVTVSAEVDNCGSGGISVSFDSAVFELTGGSCLLSGTLMGDFDLSARDGVFAYESSSAISGSVFQFTLKVKDGAPAGSHTVNVTFIADGTSDNCSVTISLACDHSYDNGCDESCNLCGATREADHAFDSGKITTAATCGKEGVKTYTCATCGKTKTEAVPTAAHTWDSGKVTKDATCSEAGEKKFTCTACGATKTEETAKLSHNYEVIGYSPATCEENGAMEFRCLVCGYTYGDYIEAKGHSYDFDCDEECNTCGEVRETEHDYGDSWFSDKTSHYQQCNICGLAQEPAPHVPGPEANETEDQVCLTCGFILEPAGRHTHKGVGNFLGNDSKHWFLCSCGELMGESDHRWEDTGIENGQQTYKCMICSRVKSEPVETTAPATEATTLPQATTPPATELPEEPAAKELLKQYAWVIPVAIVGLSLLVAGLYIIIGLILAYRKPAKFAKKNRPAAAAPMEEEVPMEETEETEEAETEAPEEE